jgi:transcriptional regulator with XRE-family HTH domain
MDDPLLKLMKSLRTSHQRTQIQIAACMHIAEDTYRHIEKGRRPLPGYRRGFGRWIRSFLDCVGATPEEERRLKELAWRTFLEEWSHDLDEEPPGLE